MPRQILARHWSRLPVLCGKAHFFALDLPHSDACYVRAYPAAVAEAWMDGHVHFFAFFPRGAALIPKRDESDSLRSGPARAALEHFQGLMRQHLRALVELADLHAAIKQALDIGAIGFAAVKHLLLCRVECRPPRLDMAIYPCLPRARVETTSARSCMQLLSGDTKDAARAARLPSCYSPITSRRSSCQLPARA
jgi:hypothetical protein